jgi:hypothetical protein
MNILKPLTYAFLVGGLACSNPDGVFAGEVIIDNQHSGELDIVIEPGDGSLLGSSTHQIKHQLEPGEEKSYNLKKSDLGNHTTFSVMGSVTMPSLHNKCGPLPVSKNYRITFVESKLGGAICVFESLQNSPGTSGKNTFKNYKTPDKIDRR